MNKQEFLSELSAKLSGLPEEDINKSIEYYSEMIDDRTEDGLNEDEAVAALGSMDKITADIFMDTSMPKLVKAKLKPKKAMSVWEIVLLVLGFPLWFSLLAAAFAVLLSVYIVIWCAALVLYAVVLSLAVCAAALIPVSGFILFKSGVAPFFMCIGTALICAALAMLFYCVSVYATKGICTLSRGIWRGIKRCFIRKENTK